MVNTMMDVNITALAERILTFLLEYDYHHFLDTLEIGETVEDAQAKIELDLSSGEKTSELFGQFRKFYIDESLSSKQRDDADNILEKLTVLIVRQLTE